MENGAFGPRKSAISRHFFGARQSVRANWMKQVGVGTMVPSLAGPAWRKSAANGISRHA
jgi:hypothetical protein